MVRIMLDFVLDTFGTWRRRRGGDVDDFEGNHYLTNNLRNQNGIDIGSVVCGNHMGSLRCEVCNSLNKSRSEDSYSNNANTLGNSEVRCINTTYLMDLNHSVMSELMLNVFDNWVEVYRSMFSFGERLDRIHLKLKERLNVNWMELVVKDSEEIKSLLSDAGAAQCWAPVGLSRSGMGDVVLIALRLGGPRDVSFSG
ncbi:hypothetical protein FOZ60_011526 [Perkinsus olseni]|uniref:Uncharacterized protein n=1 Tax=Perkinsus olseni TaxID=32597 RepID=A0A7J6NEA8_PEROL|nr:hypothetical protein FOZ60_011526 [Perkinsus olseni]